MRRASFLLALSMSVSVSSIASAEDQLGKEYHGFAYGLIGVPVEPALFTDIYNLGFGFGGGVEAHVSPAFSILGALDFKTYGLNRDGLFDELFDPAEQVTDFATSGGRSYAFSLFVLGKAKLVGESDGFGAPFFK